MANNRIIHIKRLNNREIKFEIDFAIHIAQTCCETDKNLSDFQVLKRYRLLNKIRENSMRVFIIGCFFIAIYLVFQQTVLSILGLIAIVSGAICFTDVYSFFRYKRTTRNSELIQKLNELLKTQEIIIKAKADVIGENLALINLCNYEVEVFVTDEEIQYINANHQLEVSYYYYDPEEWNKYFKDYYVRDLYGEEK